MADEIKIEGASGSRDENKITTFSVPYYVKSLAEVVTVGKGGIKGLTESTRSWQAWNDGTDGWIVTVIYKGHAEDDVEAQDEEKTSQWSMDFDFAEEPIQSHPNWFEIERVYGGRIKDGDVEFDKVMPSGGKSTGLGGKKLKPGDKNPMTGTTTYSVMRARVTRSWSSPRIPKNAVDDIGKVYKKIPNAPPEIDKVEFGDRTWLAMPPKLSQNGKVWRIVNEWLLSPSTGWLEEVYKAASK